MPSPSPDFVLVQVRLMGRTLSLRVRAGDEEKLRAWATLLDARLNEFRRAFPTQPEVVAVLTVALGLAEEVHTLHEAAAQQDAADARLADALVALDLRLAAALSPRLVDGEVASDAADIAGAAYGEEGDFEDEAFDFEDEGPEDEAAPEGDAPA